MFNLTKGNMNKPDRKDYYNLTKQQCQQVLAAADVNYYNNSSLFWLQEAVFQLDWDKWRSVKQ